MFRVLGPLRGEVTSFLLSVGELTSPKDLLLCSCSKYLRTMDCGGGGGKGVEGSENLDSRTHADKCKVGGGLKGQKVLDVLYE